jgi:hypothetical protein
MRDVLICHHGLRGTTLGPPAISWSSLALVVATLTTGCGSPAIDPDAGLLRGDGGAVLGGTAAVVQAGSCLAPAPGPEPACGTTSCGDGQLTRCTSCGVEAGAGAPGASAGTSASDSAQCGPGQVATTSVEACDGADLGEESCASLGFSGGQLGCGPTCAFDTRRCVTCVDDPHVQRCGHASVNADQPSSLAVTASDTEIVVAWVAGPGAYTIVPGTPGQVRLGRFDTDLALIEEIDCIGPQDAQRVAIARTASGYLLAIETTNDILLQPLDTHAMPRGQARSISGAWFPLLASRQTGGQVMAGGPLLVYSVRPSTNPSGNTIQATLVDDDGGQASAPVTLFTSGTLTDEASAVFTGDGFLVADLADDGNVVRVGLDGQVAAKVTLPHVGEFPQLAWTGTEARVLYGDLPDQSGLYWMRLDKQAKPLSEPVRVADGSDYYNIAPIIDVGGDTLVLLPGGLSTIDQSTHLEVARLSSAGVQGGAPYSIVQDPERVANPRWTRFGRDVIVAWIGGLAGFPGHIGLARLKP